MRIVVNGQQPFGKAVLEALLERGETVVGVYSAPDKPGQRPDALKEAALERNIPVYQPASFKSDEVRQEMAALEPDLVVMAYVILLVPRPILELPSHGTIQYHPSLLPRHRGPSSINWPIIQGESKTGLTIFWPDEGLDTGPILLQKKVDIGEDDTVGTLYFNKLYPMGVEAMVEAVELIKAGKAAKVPQDEAQATYEGWCRKADVEIDWSRPSREVYNLVRGADPQPGAWTRYDGKTLQLYDAAKLPDAGGGRPGEVVEAGPEGLTVATADGRLVFKRVRPEAGQKVAVADFLASEAVKPGAALG